MSFYLLHEPFSEQHSLVQLSSQQVHSHDVLFELLFEFIAIAVPANNKTVAALKIIFFIA
jgi:hypothetical protein